MDENNVVCCDECVSQEDTYKTWIYGENRNA